VVRGSVRTSYLFGLLILNFYATDDHAKWRAASQIVHAHSNAELARILVSVESDMRTLIHAELARLGRKLEQP
jgi:hypothetical protein